MRDCKKRDYAVPAAATVLKSSLNWLVLTFSNPAYNPVLSTVRLSSDNPRPKDPRRQATARRLALISLILGLIVLTGTAETAKTLAGTDSLTTATTTLANTTGEQRTLVVLVNFQNSPSSQPYSVETVRNLIFGSVSNFYYESSYHQTWLSGDVYGWFTIPMDSTVCDTAAMATHANAAAVAAGANLGSYSRYVYVFPHNSCSWPGITLKSSNSVPRVYLNGSLNFKDAAHELGHSFGLYHSGSLDCGAASIGSNCTVSEYGDKFDDMGNGSYHFNAYQKERMGWLNSGGAPPIVTVEQSGTYFVEPLETLSAGGAKALRILKSIDAVTGDKTWYYFEFRQPVGFDSALASNSNVVNGLIVHQATHFSNSFNFFFSYLLDMTPETSSWLDPALVVGRTFQDGTAGFNIVPIACTNAGCSVNVNFSPSTGQCVNSNPSLTMTPSQPAPVLPGTAQVFTVNISNNNSANCSPTTFNLQAGLPNGWSALLSSPSVVLSSGTSGSMTLTATSPVTALAGTYNVAVTAANSSASVYSGSASAVSTISPLPTQLPVTVAISTDKPSYSLNSVATMKAVVLRGTAPIAGVTVTFTLTKANGSRVTIVGTTAGDGSVTAKYRIAKKDPRGVYQDEASSSLDGSRQTATTSFTVN